MFFQLLTGLCLYLLFLRKKDVPWALAAIMLSVYITVPAIILVKGVQSAIFILDLLGPILAFYVLCHWQTLIKGADYSHVLLSILLIFLPPLMLSVNIVRQGGQFGLSSRSTLTFYLWYYRDVEVFLIYLIASSAALTSNGFKELLKFNIAASGILALLGLLHYAGVLNLAAYEGMADPGYFAAHYQHQDLGLGFMGLFRGAVGQWFATIIILIVGSQSLLPIKHRILAFIVVMMSIGAVLFSYSRAGLVGTAIGLATLGLLGKGIKQRILIAGIAIVIISYFTMYANLLGARYDTILTGAGGGAGRVTVWQRAIHYFSNNPGPLFLGVGPANYDATFKITGAYGAHNEYLDVIFQYGLFGLIVLIVFILFIFQSVIRLRIECENGLRPLYDTLFAIFVANCSIGLTQNHLIPAYSLVMSASFIYCTYGAMYGMKRYSQKQVLMESQTLDYISSH